ncbi:glutathione S-transferase family protein [Aeromonas enteropelogenes]|uniref:glutathione S-transferase family protein n=1 Tax=Aeromonas enteropelogenes TaxID=29489 RepID=UPI003B9F1E0B
MITLYGTPVSRALRVSWLLEELGIEWQFQFLDFAKGENRSDWFLALNPSGKMPVIKDGEFVLTESAAIMQYLAEVYGPEWLPERGTQASALHAQWVSFITCELEQPLWTIGKHRFALPEAQRLAAIFPTAKWEFDKAAAIAESWVPESGYLLGEQITIADLLLAHTLMWATRFEQSIPPKLAAYRDRLAKRPALQAVLAKTQAIADAGQAK